MLFHLVARATWEAAREVGEYRPAGPFIAEVRYEPADGDQFPHLYGPLNLDAVIEVRPVV